MENLAGVILMYGLMYVCGKVISDDIHARGDVVERPGVEPNYGDGPEG